MNFFFGFDNYLSTAIEWKFSLNHLFLVFFIIGMIFALYYGLSAKTEKGKKITKIVLACVLLAFELGRIGYDIAMHKYRNNGSLENFDWWWNIGFQMCTIMVYVTIATLFASAFVKNKNSKIMKLMYNILFGCAMIGGILTVAYPDYINGSRPILHFTNIQTIITHMLLVFVPIYLLKIKEFSIRLKNLWMPVFGYIFVGAVSMTASQISGQNFAFALLCDLLLDVGINIPFPWHLPVVLLIIFTIPTLIYLVFELVYKIKNKNNIEFKMKEKAVVKNKKFYVWYLITINLSFILGVLLTLLIPSWFTISPISTWVGLVCIIPLALLIGGLTLSLWLKSKAFEKPLKTYIN